MNDIRVGEAFCGVGGFRLGLERAGGYKVVWANEIDKYACQVYRKHFGSGELVEGDVRDIKADDIPDIDLLCAGFPCQTFSIASAKRKGIGESRGALFVQIARIASAKRPKFLLLENVRGLLSSSGGRDFAVILRTLGSLGYILSWEVLNSKHYGVAQNRERVYIVGHLGRECFRQVFPITQNIGSLGETFGEAQGEGERLRGNGSESIAPTLSSRYGKDGADCLIQLNDDGGSQVNRVFSPDGLAPTIPTACGGSHVPKISTRVDEQPSAVPGPQLKALRMVRTEKAKRIRARAMKNGKDYTPFGEGYREMVESKENITGAVTGALNRDTLVGGVGTIRMLTPKEYERLQGFPDDWTKIGITNNPNQSIKAKLSRKLHGLSENEVVLSDTQRYKLLGNAVTVNVVQYVGGLLK